MARLAPLCSERERERKREVDRANGGEREREERRAREREREREGQCMDSHDIYLKKRYSLYRNKEIRPSNIRVLRSQFNSDLPETLENPRVLGTLVRALNLIQLSQRANNCPLPPRTNVFPYR